MIYTRVTCLGLAALVGLWSTPLLGQVKPVPAKHFARVELAISCDQSTPENQKDDLSFAVYSGRDKLCVDRKTHPGMGLFLWVLEPNTPARRFYERLGAVYVGQDVWSPPDGGAVPKLRYAWEDPKQLLQCG